MIPVLVAFGSFLTTLAGGLAALRFRDQQHLILGLAAGLMLGVVGFDLVPEALTQQPGELFGVPVAMLAAVLGFLTLHVVERSVAIHRAHEGEYAGHLHAPGLGVFAGSALVGHSLLDGVAIGAGFQAGGTVGAVVAIAVLSHDFADGFNTYTITSLYGNDRRRALGLLVADALAPVTGAAITLIVTIPEPVLGLYLGFLAGVLLYLATSDILPEPTPTIQPASPWPARSSASASCGWSSASPAAPAGGGGGGRWVGEAVPTPRRGGCRAAVRMAGLQLPRPLSATHAVVEWPDRPGRTCRQVGDCRKKRCLGGNGGSTRPADHALVVS